MCTGLTREIILRVFLDDEADDVEVAGEIGSLVRLSKIARCKGQDDDKRQRKPIVCRSEQELVIAIDGCDKVPC